MKDAAARLRILGASAHNTADAKELFRLADRLDCMPSRELLEALYDLVVAYEPNSWRDAIRCVLRRQKAVMKVVDLGSPWVLELVTGGRLLHLRQASLS